MPQFGDSQKHCEATLLVVASVITPRTPHTITGLRLQEGI